jgi:hypothetical protein
LANQLLINESAVNQNVGVDRMVIGAKLIPATSCGEVRLKRRAVKFWKIELQFGDVGYNIAAIPYCYS